MSNHFDISGRSWDTAAVALRQKIAINDLVVTRPAGTREMQMSEDRKSGADHMLLARSGNVTTLARQALSVVAQTANTDIRHPDQNFLTALIDAIQARSEDARSAFLRDAEKAGLTPSVLIDIYIPEAARSFGDDWCSDQMSFADVTIGTAHLQSMVRELDTRIVRPESHASVVMIVLKDAYHTLGAMVATSQLRRNGISVRLMLGQDVSKLPRDLECLEYDAVMISATQSERLENLRDLVDHVRENANTSAPVVIGGLILEDNLDLKTLTGADYTLNDPIEAARTCGLMNHLEDAGPGSRTKGT